MDLFWTRFQDEIQILLRTGSFWSIPGTFFQRIRIFRRADGKHRPPVFGRGRDVLQQSVLEASRRVRTQAWGHWRRYQPPSDWIFHAGRTQLSALQRYHAGTFICRNGRGAPPEILRCRRSDLDVQRLLAGNRLDHYRLLSDQKGFVLLLKTRFWYEKTDYPEGRRRRGCNRHQRNPWWNPDNYLRRHTDLWWRTQ